MINSEYLSLLKTWTGFPDSRRSNPNNQIQQKDTVFSATSRVFLFFQGRKGNQGKDKGDTDNRKQNNNRKKVYQLSDEECEQVTNNRKNKLKTFLKEGDLGSFIEFKKARTVTTSMILEKKRQDWKKLLLNVNRFTNTKLCEINLK